jgi:uncharacterized protein (DUF1015 family)
LRIKEFQALRPPAGIAGSVAAVPYDTVNSAEAAELAKGNRRSFLHVSRSEIDFPSGTDPYSDAVYARAAENLKSFQEKRILIRERSPHLYVYQQKMGEHVQSSVVACCNVEDYEKNVILKHEKTRRDKEDDRARHIKTLRTHTGPVFITYRDVPAIDAIVAKTQLRKPLFDFTAPDGIQHKVWRALSAKRLANLFAKVPVCYIADGHHRAAASARVAAELRAENPNHTGQEEYNWFLAALFPAGQLQILPYNRCVSDLNGMTEPEFLAAVRTQFDVKDGAEPAPSAPQHVSMYLAGKWYCLSWSGADSTDAISALDVSVLQSRLLDRVLGIKDPRTDKRIDFIGGIRGANELVRLVDSGRAAVAFSMYPVSVRQVMAVADSGAIMPPKSTWFEPKLRSGLLVHTF